MRALLLLLSCLLPLASIAQQSGYPSRIPRLTITDDLSIGDDLTVADRFILTATNNLNIDVVSPNLHFYTSGSDPAAFKLVSGLTAIPALFDVSNEKLSLFGAAAAGNIVAVNAQGGTATLRLRRTNGTFSSPTSIANNDLIAAVQLSGNRNGTLTTNGAINWNATEAWSGASNNGYKVTINSIAAGTATNVASITANGLNVTLGNALISAGTQSISGCSLTANVGGQMAGRFESGVTGVCTVTVTLPAATNGWHCRASNEGTPANAFSQTASSTTSCTLSGTTSAADVIVYSAIGY